MKNFRVTVNGNSYDVSVEEVDGSAVMQTAQPQASIPQPKPVEQKPAAPAAPKAAVPTNAFKIESPMPGTLLDIKVSVGQDVEKNQVVAVLEAMKMENEIVSPVAGKVATINSTKGSTLNSSDLILTIEQ